jgi:hypothetical protein
MIIAKLGREGLGSLHLRWLVEPQVSHVPRNSHYPGYPVVQKS